MHKKSVKNNRRKQTKQLRRRKIKRHTRKMKGGNFGGNCPDPNFSIYNTNMLKLFPYNNF